jgi:hypothetical protein
MSSSHFSRANVNQESDTKSRRRRRASVKPQSTEKVITIDNLETDVKRKSAEVNTFDPFKTSEQIKDE